MEQTARFDSQAKPSSANTPVFAIDRIYLKDASLECPASPRVLYEPTAEAPEVEVNVKVEHQKLDGILYEVALSATVHVKQAKDGNTVFLIEAVQAGTFQLDGFDEATMAMVLEASAPNVLFPYLRETVASLASRAGFIPLYLQPLNFEAMVAARRQAAHAAPASVH